MRERTVLVADPALTREQSRIELALADGRTFVALADAAKGTPRNPVSIGELRQKFRTCAAGRLPDDQVEELLDLLLGVGELQDLRRLFALLGSAQKRKAA
jgi:hypothetical protein